MSPSEDQLRAALKQGEGTAPNADTIIRVATRVRREQRERRVRVISAVGAAVVVAGIGVGITQHSNRHPTSEAAAPKHVSNDFAARDSNAAAGAVPDRVASGNQAGPYVPAGSGVGGASTTSGCPAAPVRYLLPGGGGLNQFGSNEKLVTKPVSALTFCIYDQSSSGGGAYQGSRVLAGSDAQAWIDQADSATSSSGLSSQCVVVRNVEILVTNSDGQPATPLAVTGGCGYVTVTNGTAIRYVPVSKLDAVTGEPLVLTTPSVSGAMSGSPAR